MRWPSPPTNSGADAGQRGQSPGGGGATSGVGESGLSAVEVVLEDVDEDGFDGDPAVFVALAADLEDRAVVGAAQVADVGAHQLVGAQTGQQPGEDEGAVTLEPVGRSGSLRRCRHRGQQGGDRRRPAGTWAAPWVVWVVRSSASGWPRSARR